MSTTKLQAPDGYEYAVVSTQYGNYQVAADDTVTVDSRAVSSLVAAGFTVMGLTRTAGGRHVVTADEATAGTLDIDTGFAVVDAQVVQVLRDGNVVTSDADVTVADGVVTVADGATYNTTEDDVINWVAVGTDQEA